MLCLAWQQTLLGLRVEDCNLEVGIWAHLDCAGSLPAHLSVCEWLCHHDAFWISWYVAFTSGIPQPFTAGTGQAAVQLWVNSNAPQIFLHTATALQILHHASQL